MRRGSSLAGSGPGQSGTAGGLGTGEAQATGIGRGERSRRPLALTPAKNRPPPVDAGGRSSPQIGSACRAECTGRTLSSSASTGVLLARPHRAYPGSSIEDRPTGCAVLPRSDREHAHPGSAPFTPEGAVARRTSRNPENQVANRALPRLCRAVRFSPKRFTIASCVSGPESGQGPADAVGFPDGPMHTRIVIERCHYQPVATGLAGDRLWTIGRTLLRYR